MALNSDYILEGAALALERAGQLMAGSTREFDAGSPNNAVVLAAFGREELGKAIHLLELIKRIDDGEKIEAQDLKLKQEHISKQEKARLSLSLRATGGTELAQAMSVFPGDEGYEKAQIFIEAAMDKSWTTLAATRHAQRQASLYVDPEVSSGDWKAPKNVPKDETRDFVFDAVNDYSVFMQGMSHYHPQLDQYISKTSSIKILPPVWPRV